MNKFVPRQHLTPYEVDYHQWSVEQARLLREGRLEFLDRKNLAEEIESLGRSEKREIESRLEVLLMHLLKWQHQPENRKGGWEASIREQRRRLLRVLDENPSLADYPAKELEGAYRIARAGAERETGIAFEAFPTGCPYSIEQVLDGDFFPESI